MVYTLWYIPITAWYIPSKSGIYHEATFQLASLSTKPGTLRMRSIWKVGSFYVTFYITGGVLYHIFLLYNMLYGGVT